MAGGKLTARQKMINMMYLVLTSLLALNVSKEIIKTFNLLENSLDKSTFNIANKSEQLRYSLLQKSEQENEKAREAHVIALEVKNTADAFYSYVENIKKELEKRANGRAEETSKQEGKTELLEGDNIEKHAHFFVGEKNGEKVEKQTNDTRKKLISAIYKAKNNKVLNPTHSKDAFFNARIKELEGKATLTADATINAEGKKVSWTGMFLENSPLAGVMTILSKIQNDCRNLESEVTQTLAESVGINNIEVDGVYPVIAAPTSAILTGQTYEADLFLAAYNSQSTMQVMVNGQAVEVKEGKGKFRVAGNTPGNYNYKVAMNLPGSAKTYTAEGQYSVFSPMASVSCDELQIFYVGLENPVTVSAAGIKPEDLIISSTVGTIERVSTGKYHVLIPARTANECVINISARGADGRVMPLSTQKFRIRNVSKPIAKAGPVSLDKTVNIAELLVQANLTASNPDFPYQSVSYRITSYRYTLLGSSGRSKTGNVNGASLTALKEALKSAKPGDYLLLDNLFYSGPDGIKPLANIGVQLK